MLPTALLVGLALVGAAPERAPSGAGDPGTIVTSSPDGHRRDSTSATTPAHTSRRSMVQRARVVMVARRYLGTPFRGDCSAFVRRVFSEARVPLQRMVRARTATESLYRSLDRVRGPRAGDLVFFHRTYDRDGRHRANRFTHVGIVESVDGPRVSFIHRSSTGVQRLSLNAARPHDADENGMLRRRRSDDSPEVRHLAGELLAGYASAWSKPAARHRSARAASSPVRRGQAATLDR